MTHCANRLLSRRTDGRLLSRWPRQVWRGICSTRKRWGGSSLPSNKRRTRCLCTYVCMYAYMTCVTVHTFTDSYYCINTGPTAVLYIPAKNNPAVGEGEGGYPAAAAAHGRCLCRDSSARPDPLTECACVGCMLHLAVDAAATHIINACGPVLTNPPF